MSTPSPSGTQDPAIRTAEPTGTTNAPSPAPRPYRFPSGVIIWIVAKVAAAVLWACGCHVAAVVIYLILDPWLFWQIAVPAARGFGPTVSRFRTEQPVVWLTIDDGPDPATTPRVLDLLDHHGARATFFVIGESVRSHPELAKEIARRGHQLANHTFTHPARWLWRAGPSRTAREIDDASNALAQLGLTPTPYFRAPAGIKNIFLHRLLARRGIHLVAWSARGFDSVLSETKAAERIMRQLKRGAIILTHEGRSDLSRVRVLERVLKGMTECGFTCVFPEPESFVE